MITKRQFQKYPCNHHHTQPLQILGHHHVRPHRTQEMVQRIILEFLCDSTFPFFFLEKGNPKKYKNYFFLKKLCESYISLISYLGFRIANNEYCQVKKFTK